MRSLAADHTIQVTLLTRSLACRSHYPGTCVYETSRPAARKTKQFSGNLGNFLLKRCHRSWYLEEWGERTGDFIQCRHHGMWPQRVPSSRRFETLNGSGFSFKQMLWTVRCSDYSIILSPKKSEPTVTAGRRRCWFVWNGCDKSSVPILSFKIRKWSGSPETGSEDHHQCRLVARIGNDMSLLVRGLSRQW